MILNFKFRKNIVICNDFLTDWESFISTIRIVALIP